jgi:hypothetical protein
MIIDIYISSLWFYIGLIMFLISISKDTLAKRRFSASLFAIFCLITCFKSGTINQDIANYVLHFDGMQYQWAELSAIFYHWNFEPGYNLIVSLISMIYMFFEYDPYDEGLFIFLITLVPSAIFMWQFLKYRYSSSTILFIYATIILISSTTIIRHYYALAITFVVLNKFILDSKRGGLMLFSPILFHYTTIPVVFSLILDNIRRNFYNQKLIIGTIVICIIGFAFIGLDSLNFLINKAYDRATNTNQHGGLRNILNLCIIFLMLLKVDNFSLAKERMNLLLWLSISISLALIPFYGLNRITSFFSLLIIVYFFKYQKERIVNWILCLFALASLVFFYLNHNIQSDIWLPRCAKHMCDAFYL